MQNTKDEIIRHTLTSLRLDDDAINIYLYLCYNGHSSALNISSKTAISRTQVYRHLDALTKLNLVSEEKPHWGTYFYALPISNLESNLNQRKQDLDRAEANLKKANDVFEELFYGVEKQSDTITYRGLPGLKQALWNITKAEVEYKTFEVDHISNLLDTKFARSLRQKTVDSEFRTYDLSNNKVHKKADLEPIDLSLSKIKYISPDILKIKFEIIIYNQQITLIDYFKPEPIALEIFNPSLNLMMNQMFDAFWKMAEEVEWVD